MAKLKTKSLTPIIDLELISPALVNRARVSDVYVFGLDEVGRGCLAGPVYAACSVHRLFAEWPAWPSDVLITDSKKLNAIQKDRAHDFITSSQQMDVHVATSSVEEIDKINILHASGLAMFRAFDLAWNSLALRLKEAPKHYVVLIDGNFIPLPFRSSSHASAIVTVVKGDSKSFAIAAASIFAKKARDSFMQKLAQDYPGYAWETNVGYFTPEHKAGLIRHGYTPWHRRSFKVDLECKLHGQLHEQNFRDI